METERTHVDEEEERNLVLAFLQKHPGQIFEEAEIKTETGVAKNRVRNLVRGVAGIDNDKLNAGVVCWNYPAQDSSTSKDPLTTDH